jgi:flagellar basal-body rod modification protein FlgD
MIIPPSLAASAALSAASLLIPDSATAQKTAPNDVVNQADFLQLLITQLQNQDPLNPLDSANFSSQLAQFSSLQQLTEINQHLAKQASGTTGADRLSAVSFLGNEVRGLSSSVTVTDGTATVLDYKLASSGAVQAKVFDENGRVVATLELGTQSAGAQRFDLATAPGAPVLADGTYNVLVATTDASGASTVVETTVAGRVTGVDLSSDPPVLLLGTRRLALGDVREVSEDVPPA